MEKTSENQKEVGAFLIVQQEPHCVLQNLLAMALLIEGRQGKANPACLPHPSIWAAGSKSSP